MSLISSNFVWLKNIEACEYLGVDAMWLGRNRRGLNIPVIPWRKSANNNNRWYFEYRQSDLDNARGAVNAWKLQAKANRKWRQSEAKDKPRDVRIENMILSRGNKCEIITCKWDTCEMKSYRQCEKPKEEVNESETR